MHVQTPPFDHAKIVYCLSGEVMDVVLDLRRDSSAFKIPQVLELTEGSGVYLPRGVAHGFFVRSEIAVLGYHVSSEHDPDHDVGIRWDSIGVTWPSNSPITSDRDAALPTMGEFSSPFVALNLR